MPLPWREPRDVDLASLRVSFHTDNGVMTPTAETIRTVEAVAHGLSPQVGDIGRATPPGIEAGFENGLLLARWDGGAAVARILREAGTTEHTLRGLIDRAPLNATELDRVIADWYAFRSRMHSFMERYDAIVCPVNAMPAPPHGGDPAAEGLAAFSYTIVYNLTGWPAAVVRAGTSSEGLPIGIQIVARPGREDVALAIASSVEAAYGGFQRPDL